MFSDCFQALVQERATGPRRDDKLGPYTIRYDNLEFHLRIKKKWAAAEEEQVFTSYHRALLPGKGTWFY